ncbi:MAG: sensor domain-containing diguanylate cyclase [Lachnospira sp.]|nr:sensor domain-containing diguanylate cyclase [Lachnospira sp.]
MEVYLMYDNAEGMLHGIFHYMNLLIGEKDFNKTIRILTDLGRLLVNSDRASFWYWDKEKGQYWTLASSGTEKIVVPEGSGIIGAAIMSKETIMIDNPYEDERFNQEVDKQTGYVTKSILCMPVNNEQGEVIGAYQAINKLDADCFNNEDMSRLALAAVYCGKVLEAHLLQNISRVDKLTGLKNRHIFDEVYRNAVVDGTKPVALIMCDIDFFKKVNDNYGHNGGDSVLINISKILLGCVGQDGTVIRWGGEEFLLVLPDCDLEKAIVMAELIRRKVETAMFIYGEHHIKVTMSFGLTNIDENLSSDDNVRKADEKLYLSKANGRNRITY